jgi:molecular chaperone Hsp33
MLQSEQLNSLFLFAYTKERVVGFMLQQLPDTKTKFSDDIKRICTAANTLTHDELLTADLSRILPKVFPEDDIILLNKEKVKFSCTCSLERVTNMLRSLGEEEILSIITEQGSIDVTCDFCNSHYTFTEDDVKAMFSAICFDIESISNEIH